jgi:hypothetical protein
MRIPGSVNITIRLYISGGGRGREWYGTLSDWGPFAEYYDTKIKTVQLNIHAKYQNGKK